MDKYRMVVDGDDWHELNQSVTSLKKELEKKTIENEKLVAEVEKLKTELTGMYAQYTGGTGASRDFDK